MQINDDEIFNSRHETNNIYEIIRYQLGASIPVRTETFSLFALPVGADNDDDVTNLRDVIKTLS